MRRAVDPQALEPAVTLRVVGSGLGRTGTMSLKAALEILLGGACYHMIECFGHPDHPAQWHAGIRGDAVDWDALLAGYVAAVDWPSAACWKELADHYPDALILHSERPADDWFRSADATIFEGLDKPLTPDDVRDGRWMGMAKAMLTERFTPDYLDRDAAIAAFEAWNADVRATAPADRLLIWNIGDGWGPICAALGLPAPAEPFPHRNTTAEFREMSGLDE
jgi:hypothetical protein